MAVTFNSGNFVKFVRGTSALWEKLTPKDKDTLYFIADDGAVQGSLYLGETLIAGQIDIPTVNISTLGDVILSNIHTDDILVYDETAKMWVNKPLATALSELVTVMSGASASEDGKTGLVPQPVSGQENLFLRGDATWANPTAALEVTVSNLIGKDTGLTVREIAKEEATTAVATIVADAPEAFDTLKEIADWIESHPSIEEVTGLDGRVSELEETLFGAEEDASAGLVSVVSTLQTTVFGNSEGVIGLESKVADLQNELKATNAAVDVVEEDLETVKTDLAELQEALRWQDMAETTD